MGDKLVKAGPLEPMPVKGKNGTDGPEVPGRL